MKLTPMLQGLCLAIFAILAFASCHPQAAPPLPPAPPKAPSTPQSEAQLKQILHPICDEANRYYKEEGFPIGVVSPDLCSLMASGMADFDDESIVRISTCKNPKLTENLLDVDMLATSGRVVNFFNWAVDTANTKYRQGTPAPTKWTDEHAIEVASKFAAIFLKPWHAYLAKPIARSQGTNTISGQSLYPVDWEITWGIQSPSGIAYERGGVKVLLSEKYGPYIASIYIGTAPYEDQSVKPIPQEMALANAQKGVKAMLSEVGKSDGFLPNAKIASRETVPYLMVVEPNKDTQWQPKSIPYSGFLNQSKARLAWIVSYKITTTDQYKHGDFRVYVDALDGRILCCSSPMLMWWA